MLGLKLIHVSKTGPGHIHNIDGLVQERRNSIANELELRIYYVYMPVQNQNEIYATSIGFVLIRYQHIMACLHSEFLWNDGWETSWTLHVM